MDHVAFVLGKTGEEVRAVNMTSVAPNTPMTGNLPALFQQLLTSAHVTERRAAINEFNAANKWKKKGLAAVPTEYSGCVPHPPPPWPSPC